MSNKELFRSVVKDRNFMTPNIIGYWKILNGVAEIAEGDSMLGGSIFGVTVVKDNKLNFELSTMFKMKEAAILYIGTLQ